jgi:hypothetical protein
MTTILLILIFSSCSPARSGGEQLALDIRTALLKASKLDLTAAVTADYGDRVYRFTFSFSGNADKGELLVTAPEELAGLKATVSVSGGTISYDGAELDTGPLTGDGLSPAEAVPVLISQWQSGYITGCNYETLGDAKTLAMTTAVSETVSQRTWFDVKTRLPIRAELSAGGKMVISAAFANVSIE